MDDSSPPRTPLRDGLLEVVVRVGGRPVETRLATDRELLADAPFDLQARRERNGWVVEGQEGASRVGEGDRVELQKGRVRAEVGVVQRKRWARFGWSQGDAMIPILSVTLSVLVLQLGLMKGCVTTATTSPAAPEPSPELLARLLREQFDGAQTGKLAERADRPTQGEAIEGFYLQPGHAGPITRIGGGKNLGKRVKDGDSVARERLAAEAAPRGGGGDQDALPDDVPPAEPAEQDDGEDQPIAVHVTEGWGLTDWYDTKDAREDAKDIEEKLKFSRQLLKIDPNDAYALSIRAYYEYLAMDYKAARRTYERFTTLYPEDAAGWNNLALTYKRQKQYKEEEALYRKALALEPMDDHALNNLAVCLAHQERFNEALAIMQQLEVLTPEDAYADLHRAKIYAAMGKVDEAYRFLELSLQRMKQLDTLHNIEFRQDIRVDPAFENLRKEDRFRNLLTRYYGNRKEGWWQKEQGGGEP
jgi:tetratricopeptide (TPR) repeat protein